VKQLENAGADFIVLPCNTLHQLMPAIRRHTKLEVLDIIEEVSRHINNNYKRVGIISTNKTRKEKIYDRYLGGVEIVYPSDSEQENISNIIIRIIRRDLKDSDLGYVNSVIESMVLNGAEKVILACTDLANLIGNNANTIDSTEILIDLILYRMKHLKRKDSSLRYAD